MPLTQKTIKTQIKAPGQKKRYPRKTINKGDLVWFWRADSNKPSVGLAMETFRYKDKNKEDLSGLRIKILEGNKVYNVIRSIVRTKKENVKKCRYKFFTKLEETEPSYSDYKSKIEKKLDAFFDGE